MTTATFWVEPWHLVSDGCVEPDSDLVVVSTGHDWRTYRADCIATSGAPPSWTVNDIAHVHGVIELGSAR